MRTRTEKDCIGSVEIPADLPWGIHTVRAKQNFPLPGGRVRSDLLLAYLDVKAACAQANGELGFLDAGAATRILTACDELRADPAPLLEAGLSALQGGAGTSTHMLLNEVIGRRANAHPLDEVNLHQSTNDTYPTAVRVAALRGIRELSEAFATLQGTLQRLENQFAPVVMMGRTELEEAVPITLGAQFGSFAEAIARDRWRTFKCEERLRTIHLGGTAVGTGLTAPRSYLFLVTEKLRGITGLGLSRAENGVESTANADALVEVSGILCAAASNLIKISDDLRLLHMQRLIRLPARQAGSSAMPGKVNPVIAESVIQVGIRVRAHHAVVCECASRGSLQLCEFMPLLADALLESIELLTAAARLLVPYLEQTTACPETCRAQLDASPGLITAFVPLLGYDRCTALVQKYGEQNEQSVREFMEQEVGKETVEKTLSPQNLMSSGHRQGRVD